MSLNDDNDNDKLLQFQLHCEREKHRKENEAYLIIGASYLTALTYSFIQPEGPAAAIGCLSLTIASTIQVASNMRAYGIIRKAGMIYQRAWRQNQSLAAAEMLAHKDPVLSASLSDDPAVNTWNYHKSWRNERTQASYPPIIVMLIAILWSL